VLHEGCVWVEGVRTNPEHQNKGMHLVPRKATVVVIEGHVENKVSTQATGMFCTMCRPVFLQHHRIADTRKPHKVRHSRQGTQNNIEGKRIRISKGS
jgi:NADH:ubiquinone oxidoreductase subunit B-like Fe-S oxidoreductase